MQEKKLCLCEKAYYEWVMAIHPNNPKTPFKLLKFRPEMFYILVQHTIFLRRFAAWFFENVKHILKNAKSDHFKHKLKQFSDFIEALIGFSFNFVTIIT